MQSPHPPRPPYPPRPGASPGESDRELLARLGGATPDTRAVALLMARHWRAAHDYAAICLASSADSASTATAAAFHRVLGRAGAGAVRPQLLAAVRDTVREWAADDTISAVLPELRKTTGARGLRAARSATPERRQLAERAFRALPGASQCLLWHTEVEAEPISVPGALLGVDAARATTALEQAREEFRTGCVRAHRELAPTRECRFYNRLLDIPIRRGGDLLPDVQRHLAACRYCRQAAEQLSHFEGGLEMLLAETVLGWGARRYLDSRPGRADAQEARPVRPTARARTGGRHRPASTGPFAPARRHPKAVLVGVGVMSLALLATVLVTRSWSDGGGAPRPDTTWGMVSGNSVSPGLSDGSSNTGSPSAAHVGDSVEVGRGRLRNTDAGLCLDLRGGRTDDGIETVLVECSSAGSQLWSYQDDGLLRSVVAPTRCLDADADHDTVVLADCVVHAGEVRYDLTVRGELLLRRGDGLLVAPGRDRTVVVADRNGSAGQRWVLEAGSGGTGTTRGQGLPGSDAQGGGPPAPPPASPHASKSAPASAGENSLRGAPGQPVQPGPPAAPHRDPSPPADVGPGAPTGHYQTRAAQVGCCDEPAPAAPAEGAGTRVGHVVAGVVGDTASAAGPVTAGLASVLH
ncbi:RICIN domain-containing protein [Streptomyces sp. NPDC050997]|uniref:RICIN domain-containing protein n=1 Tax=Streptomyces sp. NPDC050997 TaxID=3155519 RepID=UPI003412AB79